MKIVCPHTSVSPETRDALEGHDVEYVDVSGSETAYYDLLTGLWAAQEDFCVVEQDIVISPGTVDSFESCGKLWCAAPYAYLGSQTYAGLGCARFRAGLMRAAPSLFKRVARHDYPGHGPRHWCTLDAAMQRELWRLDRRVCARHEPVGHLHSMPTHGCVPA